MSISFDPWMFFDREQRKRDEYFFHIEKAIQQITIHFKLKHFSLNDVNKNEYLYYLAILKVFAYAKQVVWGWSKDPLSKSEALLNKVKEERKSTQWGAVDPILDAWGNPYASYSGPKGTDEIKVYKYGTDVGIDYCLYLYDAVFKGVDVTIQPPKTINDVHGFYMETKHGATTKRKLLFR